MASRMGPPFQMVEQSLFDRLDRVGLLHDRHERIQVMVQLGGQPTQVVDPAVVREPCRGVPRGHDAVDAAMRGVGIEVHRSGGGEQERTMRRAQAAVGNPKAVAGKHAPGNIIDNAVMVLCMSGRV